MTDLPIGWETAALGELADFVMGQAPPGSETNFDGVGTPFVKAGEFANDRPLIREWTTRPLKLARDTDVLICVVGATSGKINLGADCAIGRSVAAIRPTEALKQQYIYDFLKTKIDELRRGATGSAQGVISREMLSRIEVPLAPLAEQRRIVTKLDSLTGATARAHAELERLPALIQRYKQAILSAAFNGELTREWRASAGLLTPRSATLGEMIAEGIRNGLSVRGSDDPPGVRALRLSALRRGTVDLADVRYLPISGDKAERFLLREGDVLVSRGNGTKAFVGLSALVGKVEKPTIFPDTAFRIRLNQEVARSDWFALMWNSAQVRTQIEAAAKTTAGIWKISQADLNKVELRLPNVAEQLEVVRRIKIDFAWLDRVTAEHESAMRLLPRLDQAILTKAFSGELVPQDPDDELASVLLERVVFARAHAPKRGRIVRERGISKFKFSATGTLTQKEQSVNKTRKDVPPGHLCDIVKNSGGEITSAALWNASEMQIDEFYKLLRDDVAAKRLKESKNKASIIDAR